MKILVTGGAGYIGSHVCKELAKRGFQPISYDNLLRGHRDLVRWGPLEVGELADRLRLLDVFRQHRPQGVMHFAGLAYVEESVAHPELYYRNNVLGSLSLLQSVREAGINNVVFSSSCATYGIPVHLPVSESHPQEPINPYGHSKMMVERILQDYGSAYGLRSVSLRYFNAAGADPDGETGEVHDPETHATPLAIMAALGQMAAFKIFGTDYPTPDGSAVRDYVHVRDLAEAHVAALKYLLDGGATDALNLGTGIGTSVFELIASVERVGGRHVPVERCPRRLGDPPMLVADPHRAIEKLNWRPQYSNVDSIVSTAWAWHCRR